MNMGFFKMADFEILINLSSILTASSSTISIQE
jgi:hypothetical protein